MNHRLAPIDKSLFFRGLLFELILSVCQEEDVPVLLLVAQLQREQLSREGRHCSSQRRNLIRFILRLLELANRTEDYMQLADSEGEGFLYVQKLIERKEIDKAISYIQEKPLNPEKYFPLAETLESLKVAVLPLKRLEIAKSVVLGKLQNTLTFCKRQRGADSEVKTTLKAIQDTMPKVIQANSVDVLYGLEGTAAASYYRMFRKFLTASLGFTGRQYRPCPDPINAMLSLGYTLLYNMDYP